MNKINMIKIDVQRIDDVRQALKISLDQFAEMLWADQSTVSRMMKRWTMKFSTLEKTIKIFNEWFENNYFRMRPLKPFKMEDFEIKE